MVWMKYRCLRMRIQRNHSFRFFLISHIHKMRTQNNFSLRNDAGGGDSFSRAVFLLQRDRNTIFGTVSEVTL